VKWLAIRAVDIGMRHKGQSKGATILFIADAPEREGRWLQNQQTKDGPHPFDHVVIESTAHPLTFYACRQVCLEERAISLKHAAFAKDRLRAPEKHTFLEVHASRFVCCEVTTAFRWKKKV
jgi:hypothetical protein